MILTIVMIILFSCLIELNTVRSNGWDMDNTFRTNVYLDIPLKNLIIYYRYLDRL